MGIRYRLAACLAALMMVAAPRCLAQTWGSNPLLNQLEQNYVKSLNEFIHRFNGDEIPAWLQGDTSANLRQKCLLALFDLADAPDLDSHEAKRMLTFVDEVSRQGSRLTMIDSGLYAVATCQFAYRGHSIDLRLTMVYQHIRDGYYRWAIAGVVPEDLVKAGLIDTTRYGYINPVNHELHFSELSHAFPTMNGYFADGRRLDALSYVAGLAESGALKYEGCSEVEYWFEQVPGWVFSVALHSRNDMNSGWLIRFTSRTSTKPSILRRLHYIFFGIL